MPETASLYDIFATRQLSPLSTYPIITIPLSGRMPEWTKGADCKSAIRGFESHSGLCPNCFDLCIYSHWEPARVVAVATRRLLEQALNRDLG